jgi:hypothetical protein
VTDLSIRDITSALIVTSFTINRDSHGALIQKVAYISGECVPKTTSLLATERNVTELDRDCVRDL